MRNLDSVLRVHFRLGRAPDNLPLLATAKYNREGGRLQLGKVMHDLGFRIGAEIGTRYGGSAKIWCEAMPGLDLTCIDPYLGYHTRSQEEQDKVYVGAQESAKRFGFKLLKEKSLEVVDRVENASLDFVNIDGDHTFDACVQDIIRWVPKVRPGGLVLIHDYCTFKQCGVIRAVDAYTHCHRIDPWYVTRDYEPTAFWQRGTERL